MPEKEKIDINIPIAAQIKEAGERKGLKLGDDLVNPLEKKLLDDIIVKHGEAIAGTREAMNADFSSLLEDVGDLSEGNQGQLREVAEMLGETLKTKDGALQMNYELFQKILMFQRDNKMKLTGIVDNTLRVALKEKMGKKSETPSESKKPEANTTDAKQPVPAVPVAETPEVAEENSSSETATEQIPAPPVPPSAPRATPVQSEAASTGTDTTQTYEGEDERILPPVVPNSQNQLVTPSAPVVSENSSPSEAILPPPVPQTVATNPSLVATPVENTPQTSTSPDYGEKVGTGERKNIIKGAEGASDILSQTTSANVLNTKGSTKSIIKILDKYLAENPEKRGEMIQALRQQIGDFSRPLQTPEQVGAFQQLFYLAYPERFADEMKYIDGEYGSRTQETFMRDIFAMGGWEEKIEGSNGILGKNPEEISTYIAGLNEFERDVLRKHYTSGNVDQNSSPEAIKQAQLGLVLSDVNVPVDGIWTEQMAELLEYPELAKSLGNYAQNNYLTHAGGKFSCGASVGRMLNGFGIEGLPQSGRDGQNWNEILDARPDQFTKVKVNSPDEAKPGGILCFDGGGKRPRSYMAIRHGHVEVKGDDSAYYHFIRSPRWGGSAGANLENSRFTGYVYYPRKKSVA